MIGEFAFALDHWKDTMTKADSLGNAFSPAPGRSTSEGHGTHVIYPRFRSLENNLRNEMKGASYV